MCQKHSKLMYERLFPKNIVEVENADAELVTSPEQSMAEQLSQFITASTLPLQEVANSDIFSKEIQLFISGGKKTPALDSLSKSLLVIPPTSVEAERVFSAAGLFVTKLRCNLSDSTLDMLMFLKFYFMRRNGNSSMSKP